MINKYFDHIHVKTSFYIIITTRKTNLKTNFTHQSFSKIV